MQHSYKSILQSQNTILLDIPIRLQWQNSHGYCGQLSTQCCSMYYGNYISQDIVRKIAQSEFLIGQNAEKTLLKLKYQIQSWQNYCQQNEEDNQYKNYLKWIKSHIVNHNNPVIIAGYESQGKQLQYDHIYMAVGIHSQSLTSNQYHKHDKLIYMNLFDLQYHIIQFDKIHDNRKMSHNGQQLDFAIPTKNDYGIAILGIKDKQEQFLPIRLKLDKNNIKQPNVTKGQKSKQFKVEVIISQLEINKNYVLLKYYNFKNIPENHVYEDKADEVYKFKAISDKYTFNDVIDSHSMVFYRCIEAEDLE